MNASTSTMPSRTRVALAETGSGYGGSARYLIELIAHLDSRRYDLRVIAAEDGPLVSDLRQRGVPVITRRWWRFPWAASPTLNRPLSYLWFAIASLVQVAVVVPAVWWWLKRQRIDVVHGNNEIRSVLLLFVAAKLAGCRTVCHLHGWRPLTRLERWSARTVDTFICISHAGAVYHARQLEGREVVPILNGISLNGQVAPEQLARKREEARRQMGLPHDAVSVALVGRLVEWKGHEVFIRALARAAAQCPSVRGVIIGHDPSEGQAYTARLRELARNLGIEHRLQFLPWQADVWGIYAAADIVVHASTQPEPFGLVIIEAMAAARPVIATRAGGVVDIVQDDQTGLLIEPGSDEAMGQAIVRLATDPQFAARLGAAAQARVRADFGMPRNAAAVMAIYEGLRR